MSCTTLALMNYALYTGDTTLSVAPTWPIRRRRALPAPTTQLGAHRIGAQPQMWRAGDLINSEIWRGGR